jgi:sugar lactone lactonase YvrE
MPFSTSPNYPSPDQNSTQLYSQRLWLIVLLCACVLTACNTAKQISQYTRNVFRPAPVAFEKLSHVRTLAGVEAESGVSLFGDPFGIAIGGDDTAYVTDGERGVIWAIDAAGETRRVASDLNTPSGIALAPDGSLIVAETGAHVIRRINPQTGDSVIIAGKPDTHGYVDGRGADALFNAPIGVATDADGVIYVADTYNDRVRRIDAAGNVNTLAGGGDAPDYADAEQGVDARFHTPCNLILRKTTNGKRLLIADTGNHRLREIEVEAFPHRVTTLAGRGERGIRDGTLDESEFNQPIGLAFNPDGSLLVTDAGGDAIRRITFDKQGARITTLNTSALAPALREDESPPAERRQTWGFRDAPLASALMRRPTGVAVFSHGRIVFTDTDNRLVRVVSEA